MATLQVAKRLIGEAIRDGKPLSVIDAIRDASTKSAAVCEARTWWQAVRVVHKHTTADKSSLEILSDAIAAQGKTNIYAKKGPKP